MDKRRIVPFRCPSSVDFAERARHLAKLLGREPTEVRDLLARIYGFADEDALHRDLIAAERSPERLPPGPFDYTTDPRVPDPISLPTQRQNRSLDLTAAFVGETMATLPAPLWDVREMGLFATTDDHRRMFRKIAAKIEAAAPDGQPETEPTPNAYAYPERSSQGESLLAFTAKGAAIYELLKDLLDRYVNDDPPRYAREIERLARLYPGNPWAGAAYVEMAASRLQERQEQGAADETDVAMAAEITEKARVAVAQFETVLGENASDHAPSDLSSWRGPHGSDSYYYPATMYWGAVAAKASGDVETAKTWFGRVAHINREYDRFHAAEELAAIAVEESPRASRRR